MDIIDLTAENIEEQHICCGFSDKKSVEGYQKKKTWLKKAFKNGYHFQKLDVRGKVFIEYVPIEYSWLPLDGENFMVINCFWVSGQFKGRGYGKKLLAQCIKDAKAARMKGVVAVSSEKKRPFMSDPKFFKYHGFEVIDQAPPFFKLYGIRFEETAQYPVFREMAKQGSIPDKNGIVAYYSNTCPFTEYYIKQHLVNYGKKKGVPVKLHHIDSQEAGRKMPIPWIINSIFYNGELVTLEIKADRHLDKLIG